MEFLKRVGAVVTDVADAVSDASRRLALINRLKAIERAETSKSHAAYEKMGRYLAEHLPEDAPEEIRALCGSAQKAEEHAVLARKHIEALKGTGTPVVVKPAAPQKKEETPAAEPVADAPMSEPVVVSEAEPACPAEEPAEATEAEPVEASVEPAAKPEQTAGEDDASEEAAEDENDGIPFM